MEMNRRWVTNEPEAIIWLKEFTDVWKEDSEETEAYKKINELTNPELQLVFTVLWSRFVSLFRKVDTNEG